VNGQHPFGHALFRREVIGGAQFLEKRRYGGL
jgi:hypothetical protein